MTNQRESRANPSQQQLNKFKQAAREHEADTDEKRWDERLKRIVKPQSAETDKS